MSKNRDNLVCRSAASRIVIAAISLAAPFVVQATEYYVSSSAGDDRNLGTTPALPWRTLDKVNRGSFLPGDRVLFRCGDRWRGQLAIPSSGTKGNPIVFTQYGSDCNGINKPAISGADPVTGWTIHSGNIFVAPAVLTQNQQNLIENGSLDVNLPFDEDEKGEAWWYHGRGKQPRWTEENCVSGGCMQFTARESGAILATKRFALSPRTEYRVELHARSNKRTLLAASIYRDGKRDPFVAQSRFPVGTDWAPHSFVFTPHSHIAGTDSIRLEFSALTASMPFGSETAVSIDNVSLKPISRQHATAKQIFVNGLRANLAQHPNPVTDDPANAWLKIAKTQPDTCKRPDTGTNFIETSPDAKLSANSGDVAGAGIHIRTTDWIIEDQRVTGYDDDHKKFSFGCFASKYGAHEGWGYYLDNKLWMLDAPMEWYHEPENARLFAWMPDHKSPGDRVEAAHRDYGIDARYRAFIVIDGLSAEKADTGVMLSSSSNVTLRNCAVADSGVHGINAAHSSTVVITNCDVINSVRTGIHAPAARGIAITRNRITNAGNIGSPLASEGGIHAGNREGDALIERNTIRSTGYNGIFPSGRAAVRWNLIENACLVLNDCGGIYNGGDNGSLVAGNVIRHVAGNLKGGPEGRSVLANGIYLDDWSSGFTVSGNTIVDAAWGLQVHNGRNNVFQHNTVYGAREWAVRVQEDTTAASGTIQNNVFVDNRLFPANADGTYYLSSDFNWKDFASYHNNRYSGLYSATLIKEELRKHHGVFAARELFTLEQWQKQRSHDHGSTNFSPFRIAPTRVLAVNSSNLVANSTFDTGASDWERWNRNPPTNTPNAGISWLSGCKSGSGCLRFKSGTTDSLFYTTSKFAIHGGRSYRVRADIRGKHNGQMVSIDVLRAGPADYDNLGLHKQFAVGASWESFTWVFKATQDDRLPAKNQKGARLQFAVTAAQIIEIDNIKVEEVEADYNNPNDDSAILINENNAGTQALPCPDAKNNPAKCSKYADFPGGMPTTWPKTVPAMGSAIVVWTANPFRDSDFDGIVDKNDYCTGTIHGATTDERGCSFAQNRAPKHP